jgi:hypothetical protein
MRVFCAHLFFTIVVFLQPSFDAAQTAINNNISSDGNLDEDIASLLARVGKYAGHSV